VDGEGAGANSEGVAAGHPPEVRQSAIFGKRATIASLEISVTSFTLTLMDQEATGMDHLAVVFPDPGMVDEITGAGVPVTETDIETVGTAVVTEVGGVILLVRLDDDRRPQTLVTGPSSGTTALRPISSDHSTTMSWIGFHHLVIQDRFRL